MIDIEISYMRILVHSLFGTTVLLRRYHINSVEMARFKGYSVKL